MARSGLHRAAGACVLALWGIATQVDILIGQTVGVTGAVAATVQESSTGAMLYLDVLNAKGGVGGDKIEIITLGLPDLMFGKA